MRDTIKLFCCDLNWSVVDGKARVSTPQDWALIDPKEYFEWHREFGNNVMFCQTFDSGGYAPSGCDPQSRWTASRGVSS